MSKDIAIVWLRQDLRLADNPALRAAANHANVLPVYILDDLSAESWAIGGASRLWLYHSLNALNDSLAGRLLVCCGDAKKVLPAIAERYGASSVYWNRCYEPWRIRRDEKIKGQLQDDGIEVKSFNGSLLWEPWTIAKADGEPYRVFTAFYRKGCKAGRDEREPERPMAAPDLSSKLLDISPEDAAGIGALQLLSGKEWESVTLQHWRIGENAALDKLHDFLSESIANYKEGRDIPSLLATSMLSPHLHFGEISPRQVWAEVNAVFNPDDDTDAEHFLRELGWREFSYYLLYHWPQIPDQEFNPKYRNFPWRADSEVLQRWQRGQTGIPIVDAGMRQLWQTGYMHNRVRMIVASLLVKNLLIDWREGARWFWDTLFDADLANNSAGWQWVAGTGADAAPYFRIFNPVLQGEKFDPEGDYVREYCPELRDLPKKYIHQPWMAPRDMLNAAGITLGRDYPGPVVDLKSSRERALDVHKSLAHATAAR